MLNLTATMAVAFRNLARGGFRPRGTLVYLAVADEENLGTWGAEHLLEQRTRRGDGRLRRHRSRRLPDAEPAGSAPAGHRRREGLVLVPHHGARHARARVAAVPHRQRAGDRRRGRAAARGVPSRRRRSTTRGAASSKASTSVRNGTRRCSTRSTSRTSASSSRSGWHARRTRARTPPSPPRSSTAAPRPT